MKLSTFVVIYISRLFHKENILNISGRAFTCLLRDCATNVWIDRSRYGLCLKMSKDFLKYLLKQISTIGKYQQRGSVCASYPAVMGSNLLIIGKFWNPKMNLLQCNVVHKKYPLDHFKKSTKPAGHGEMDNAVTSYAGDPVLIPATSKMFFSLGHKVVGKNWSQSW